MLERERIWCVCAFDDDDNAVPGFRVFFARIGSKALRASFLGFLKIYIYYYYLFFYKISHVGFKELRTSFFFFPFTQRNSRSLWFRA